MPQRKKTTVSTRKDIKPTSFTANPSIIPDNMSIHPADKDDGLKVDKSFGAVCSRAIGKFPCVVFLGMLFLFIGLSVPYKDAPGKMSGSARNDWTVQMPPTDVNDMWNDARIRTSAADPERKVKTRSNMETGSGAITYLYKWDDSIDGATTTDVFTAKTVQEMCELERYFIDDSEYAEKFCLLQYKNNSDVDSGCAPQRLSAPRLFYAATFLNHTLDCPLPTNYRTLMVSKGCMDHVGLTASQAAAIGSIPNIVDILTAFGVAAQAPQTLTAAQQALIASDNAALLTANNNAGARFLTCANADGAKWTDTATSTEVTATIVAENPQYHKNECDKIILTIRKTIENMLPVPTTAVNPSDQQKYYVTAFPGMPSELFNFTSFQRDENLNKGAYQLTGSFACPLLPQWHVDAVKNWLYTTVALDTISVGSANMTGEQLLGFYMEKDTLTNKMTIRTKSMIYLGSPLNTYKDAYDRGKEQNDMYKAYMLKHEPSLFSKFGMIETMDLSMVQQTMSKSPYRIDPKTESGLQVDWYCGAMNSQEFSRMLGGDFAMVAFSVIFVWIWIQVHVWSPTIGSLGMLQILLSIPVTYTIYTIWVPYYSQMHILAVFLVLGVGADDVFVLTDGWKQSVRDVVPVPGESRKERLVRRMTYAYGRTASAVFNTSFTTAMAFVSTAISPIMTISAFGTYAAIAILVNYLMVITWFPAVILTFEMHIWPRFGLKWGPQDEDVWTDEFANLPDGEEMAEESVSCVDKMFEKVYARCMMHYVAEIQIRSKKEDEKTGKCCDQCRVRPFALASFIAISAWAAVMIWQMSTLEPPTKAEEFFPKDHMSTGLVDVLSEEYLGAGSNSYTNGRIVFGLKALDRSKFDRYNPDYDRGTVSFDEDFTIYPTVNQQQLLDVCTLLESKVCHVLDDPKNDYLEACTGSDHKLVRAGTLNCFIREFHDWHKMNYKGIDAMDNSLVTETEFMERLLKFRKDEVPTNSDAGSSFRNSIGVMEIGVDKLEPMKVDYVTLSFTSTMVNRKPVGVKQPLYDLMEVIVKQISAEAPKGLTYCDQDFGFAWVWMETEKALVNGLFNGLYICFPIAFAVLALATRNGPLAFIATVAIGCIVASVLGFVKAFNGWDLGIAETIAGIIVIGFSVDYVVHMGHMYIEAAEKSGAMTREDRFYYAASKMGSTVMAGAVTTAGSGAFMFLCQMRFFYKMAVLITLTIGFSFVFSFGFFMAYMIMIGPEYDSGNLGFLCGQSLVQEALHAVAERKKAVARWKAERLQSIANGGGDVTTTKTPTNNNKLPSIGVEMTAGTNINDEPEELSGVEIRNWAAEKEETDTV